MTRVLSWVPFNVRVIMWLPFNSRLYPSITLRFVNAKRITFTFYYNMQEVNFKESLNQSRKRVITVWMLDYMISQMYSGVSLLKF